MKTLINLLFLFAFGSASSQVPVLLKDINPNGESIPYGFTELNGKTIFQALDSLHGMELWVSDGSTSGTQLLMDILPGPFSSNPINFKVWNGKLYFCAADSVHGRELWVTDGTTTGTHLVVDALPAPGYSTAPRDLTICNNKLYFLGWDGLYTSDGTAAGTIRIKNSYGDNLVECNGKLIFVGRDASSAEEPWISDGTTSGTFMLKDINPGVGNSSSPTFLTSFNGKVYFVANDYIHGREPWVSDGTAAGTVLLKDIYSGIHDSGPIEFTAFKGRLYFNAIDSLHGAELWVTDGTTAGTTLFKDIYANGGGVRGADPTGLYVYNDKMYFNADTLIYGNEPWVTDGTDSGTHLLKDIDNSFTGSDPWGFMGYNGKVYFVAGTRLWVTDGTRDSTHFITAANATVNNPLDKYNSDLTVCNGSLFFRANYTSQGSEPYIIRDFPNSIDNVQFGLPSLKLYPNPACSWIDVESFSSRAETIYITDLLGQPVFTEMLIGGKMHIECGLWSRGIYVWSVINDEGKGRNGKIVLE
ncbi:MAG: hypothetical protein JWO03_324 [Bacteroidetes bacterium]|nr:hypothetical protein [Bacteroidota bacterium]